MKVSSERGPSLAAVRASAAGDAPRVVATGERARPPRRAPARIAAAFVLAVGVLAAGPWALAPLAAGAADCGGARRCRCGDTVVEDYVLTDDLGPCEKDGLRVRRPVVLDGNGHMVRGRGTAGSRGIQVDGKGSGARIRNVGVTGFERGIRLLKVERVRVEGVAAHDNGDRVARVGYGIDLAGGASRNVLERVQVFRNADEGIHLGSGAHENRIVDSEIHDNGRENVYFLRNHGNVLARSTLRGADSAAVYVKHAARSVLEGNTIVGAPIHLRGDTRDTRIVDNVLRDAGVVLQRYRDKDAKIGLRAPVSTTIRGGRIVAEGACVRVEGATGTVVEDVALACPQQVSVDDGAVAVIGAVVLPGAVRCAGPGRVEQAKRASVRFLDGSGKGVASLELRGAEDGAVLGVTDAKGIFAGLVVESLIACPGARARVAQGVKVRVGDRERELTTAELHGEVRF